jgi:putative oxidoreductase
MFTPQIKHDLAPLVLRLALAAIFIAHGFLKVSWADPKTNQVTWGTMWYPDPDRIPPALQAVVAWAELLGGVALALGFLTRVAALGIILIMAGAIYHVTGEYGFTSQKGGGLMPTGETGFNLSTTGYEYNWAIIAMCVSLIVLGSGMFSLDYYLWGRRTLQPQPTVQPTVQPAPPGATAPPVTAHTPETQPGVTQPFKTS